MNTDGFDYQIYRLSGRFFEQYSEEENTEILMKSERPYNCLLLETKWDYFICIPYRTEIRHREAYLFKKSERSREHRSGLDYSKMIILKDLSYIDNAPAIVDTDEYNETRQNINKIARQANNYLDSYIAHWKGEKILTHATYMRKYKYTTLKNFHEILGI